MKYDFAHPRFSNGMVTFDEKKPDLLYEFRKAAAFHRYDVRNGNLYSQDKKQIASVYNRFDSVFIHMLKDKKTYRLSSKKDIDLFFNDIKESFNGDNNMKLTEAKEILNKNGYKIEKFPGQEYITAIKEIFPNAEFKKIEGGWICDPEKPDPTIKWAESTVGFKYEDDTLKVWLPDWEHMDDDDYWGGEWTNLYNPKGIKDYVDAVHEEAEKYNLI